MILSNEITCCDCVDGMCCLPDHSIPLTVTSPPYDALRSYGGHSFDFEAVAEQLYRITKEGGVVCWVVQDQTRNGDVSATSLAQALYFKQLGFQLFQVIIAVANGTRLPQQRRYPNQFQYVWVLSKGRPRAVNVIRDKPNRNAGGPVKNSVRHVDGSRTFKRIQGKVVPQFGLRGNAWTYDVGYGKTTKDAFAFDHPALMAEALAEDLIISFSHPGDLIFDPMSGAATTAKMALLNNRRYLGMEVVGDYCQIGRKRLDAAHRQHCGELDNWLRKTTESKE